MTSVDPAGADPQVRVRSRRRGGTPLDMVRSLGIVGIGVLGMVAFNYFGQPERPPVTVDIAATVQAARASADFPVLAATALPSDVYANTARFTAVSGEPGHSAVFIGYTDGTSGYVSVEASNAVGAERLKHPASFGAANGQQTIAGIRFETYADADSEMWFHPATADEAFDAQITCNSTALCDALLSSLSADGAVATGL